MRRTNVGSGLGWVGLFGTTLALGCAGAPPKPALVPLRLEGGPPDAQITVNERYCCMLGETAKAGLRLRPGTYRISVEKAGYFPWDQELHVVAGAPPKPLSVQLVPLVD